MATTRPFRSVAAARAIASGSGCSESISIKSVATELSRADCLRYIDRHLVSSERRAQLYSLDHVTHAGGHLPRDGDAFSASLLGVIDLAHPLHEILGHGNAQLVHHEFGVSMAGERTDA